MPNPSGSSIRRRLARAAVFGVMSLPAFAPPAFAQEDAAAFADPAPRLDDDTVARLTDRVRQALLWQRGPDRTLLLTGLRMLRDPALRPLFVQCSACDDPFLRTQGILGLAELSPAGSIDPLLVKRIPGAREQAGIVMQAMRLGLLGDEAAADAALWPGIEPRLRVRLYERARESGRVLAVDGLRALLSDPDPVAAAMAQLELKERGEPLVANNSGSGRSADAAEQSPLDRLLARTDPQRAGDIRAVLAAVRQGSVASAARWVSLVRADPASSDLVRYEALATLLAIAPEADSTAAEWLADWTSQDDPASRSRLVLTALDATLDARLGARSASFASTVFEACADSDDPVFRALAGAGRTLADPDAPAAMLVASLVEAAGLAHAPSSRWVVRAAGLPSLDDAARATVLAACIDAPRRAQDQNPELYETASAAASLWPRQRLDLLAPILADTIRQDRAAAAVAILTGLARLGGPESSDLVASVSSSAAAEGLNWPGGPEGPAAGLATLLILSPSLAIGSPVVQGAGGEGTATPPARSLVDLALAPGVPEVLQVQAAWLALRAAGREQAALNRVLTHVEPLE